MCSAYSGSMDFCHCADVCSFGHVPGTVGVQPAPPDGPSYGHRHNSTL